jgi:selenide,water dikinase
MSDVYAMGGDVLFCLNIAGFPEDLGYDVIGQILAGGAAKVREAGAAIAGGHTVTNPEPFYGLSVTGLIHPDQIMRKSGARPGDQLFLTKPLGTGIVTTAAKLTGRGETAVHRLARRAQGKPTFDVQHLDEAILSMLRLNRQAAQAARAAHVLGATDITGFGLLGHGSEMAVASGQTSRAGLRIEAAAVPALAGVRDYIAAGYVTRGSTRNPDHFGAHVHFAASVPAAQRTLLWEAETSGGLLLAVPAAHTATFMQVCDDNDQRYWRIGEVIAGVGVEVV